MALKSPAQNSMLPELMIIGFSGHRKLADPKVAAGAIRKVFDRLTQDYSRRAVHCGEMASVLEDAARRLKMVRTWNSLGRIAMETEEALRQEVVEWHSFRQFAGKPH